jgi:hypothetical protein
MQKSATELPRLTAAALPCDLLPTCLASLRRLNFMTRVVVAAGWLGVWWGAADYQEGWKLLQVRRLRSIKPNLNSLNKPSYEIEPP